MHLEIIDGRSPWEDLDVSSGRGAKRLHPVVVCLAWEQGYTAHGQFLPTWSRLFVRVLCVCVIIRARQLTAKMEPIIDASFWGHAQLTIHSHQWTPTTTIQSGEAPF